MPKVRFVKDFDWHAPGDGQPTVAFKKGNTYSVVTPCAELAIAAEAAIAEGEERPTPVRTAGGKSD